MISDIKEIIDLFSKGEMIILIDDEERENEGDLVISSKYLTSDHINFMISYGKGLVCAPISSSIAKKLKLPLMEGAKGTHFMDVRQEHYNIMEQFTAYGAHRKHVKGAMRAVNLTNKSRKIPDGTGVGLSVLGFDEQELANIIDGLENIEPELEDQSYQSVFNILVNCEDEQHQERVYNELIEKGYKCQVQSL